ncbi:type III-B CRISPR module-associated Cmr3 family protein [Arhodomonas sp. AD133]|uniref:type III-B CRISPR module-associated Cmr3 family protein n=1 Tax=Arhodomonas sp. AD133 TaxID=3415009 RepID=UPI003EBF7593
MTEYRFIEPFDVLHFRGNPLFGDGGAAGSAQMPPWPSVFAGALRSLMLTSAGIDPAAYAQGRATADGDVPTALGTPDAPGAFTLETLTLAQRRGERIDPLFPLPADLQVFNGRGDGARIELQPLEPTVLPAGIASSAPLPQTPLLRSDTRAKPLSGYWLTAEGWQQHLLGRLPAVEQCVPSSALWQLEHRLGIALDRERRSTIEGQLYTSDAIRLGGSTRSVGFLVGVGGVSEGALPHSGVLRLGGDGRAASLSQADEPGLQAPDFDAIRTAGRFRIVLTSPGIFPEGWRLPGLNDDNVWHFDGGHARLVCAAVPRGGIVSGWDLAKRQPKTAERVAPTGSVYWFEGFEGDVEALRKLAKTGLWGLSPDNDDAMRRAEGFNRFAIANA